MAAISAETSSTIEVCLAATRALALNSEDVPFVLLYLPDPDGDIQLASAAGVPMYDPAVQTELWPLQDLRSTGSTPLILDDLAQRLPKQSVLSPLASTRSPQRVAVLPIAPAAMSSEELSFREAGRLSGRRSTRVYVSGALKQRPTQMNAP